MLIKFLKLLPDNPKFRCLVASITKIIFKTLNMTIIIIVDMAAPIKPILLIKRILRKITPIAWLSNFQIYN